MFGFKKKTNASPETRVTRASIPRRAIAFGGVELPFKEALQHLLVIGAPGSGKTTLIRLLMQSILFLIGKGLGLRALIYDAKGDLLPILFAFCDRSRIKTFNPFDDRGVSWRISSDVKEPRVALEICFTLIPREHESQPFFSDAARHLMYGVMIVFIRSRKEWTLADALRALMHPGRLRSILQSCDYTRDLVDRYFGDERLLSNIMSTIATKMLPYEPIFAAWEQAKESVSLEEWFRDESILVLGSSETSRTAMEAINRCIFKRASDLALQQTETLQLRTMFIIDELSEAGKLDGLVSLLKKGRSKGNSVTLGFQSVSGLRDSRMYGQYFTDEILGQIGNRFFGRLECPETADWASRVIGDQEIDQYTVSQSKSSSAGSGGRSNSTTLNQQVVTRRAVLPSEFMSIPPCDLENGLSGYCLLRMANPYSLHMPGEKLFHEDVLPPAKDVPEFLPRDIEAQYLKPWTDAQARRFGIRLDQDCRPNAEASRLNNAARVRDGFDAMDDL